MAKVVSSVKELTGEFAISNFTRRKQLTFTKKSDYASTFMIPLLQFRFKAPKVFYRKGCTQYGSALQSVNSHNSSFVHGTRFVTISLAWLLVHPGCEPPRD